jgi:hypothetical protein
MQQLLCAPKRMVLTQADRHTGWESYTGMAKSSKDVKQKEVAKRPQCALRLGQRANLAWHAGAGRQVQEGAALTATAAAGRPPLCARKRGTAGQIEGSGQVLRYEGAQVTHSGTR